LKYPTIFETADIAIVTKIDLAEAVEFDLEAATRNILSVRPGMRILSIAIAASKLRLETLSPHCMAGHPA
jgi:Ni2+-binding GTPase involved in maturation of urease and hydrogenase